MILIWGRRGTGGPEHRRNIENEQGGGGGRWLKIKSTLKLGEGKMRGGDMGRRNKRNGVR